jgi:uncharacterized Zn finger protein (UPF0148 family)
MYRGQRITNSSGRTVSWPCRSCQAVNDRAGRFCVMCGAPRLVACPTCSSELFEGSRFCGTCGTALFSPAPVITAARLPAASPPIPVRTIGADVPAETSDPQVRSERSPGRKPAVPNNRWRELDRAFAEAASAEAGSGPNRDSSRAEAFLISTPASSADEQRCSEPAPFVTHPRDQHHAVTTDCQPCDCPAFVGVDADRFCTACGHPRAAHGPAVAPTLPGHELKSPPRVQDRDQSAASSMDERSATSDAEVQPSASHSDDQPVTPQIRAQPESPDLDVQPGAPLATIVEANHVVALRVTLGTEASAESAPESPTRGNVSGPQHRAAGSGQIWGDIGYVAIGAGVAILTVLLALLMVSVL